MQAPKLHSGEIDISDGLAGRLIADQFPHWSALPIVPVVRSGTECVLYRLGDDMVMRLPRRPGEELDKILTEGLLSRLAPFLPVPVPALIALGQPTAEYPASWGVLRWVAGDTPLEGHLATPGPLAHDLAKFLTAMWAVELAPAPAAYRGGALIERNEFTLDAIDQVQGLIEARTVRSIWNEALDLPPRQGRSHWIHADLMPGNLVTMGGRLAGVIDFAAAGVGDPAQDLIVAWMLLPADVRPAFRRAVGVDDATWLGGRARALSMALGHLDYYADSNAVMADNARFTISEVCADYRRTSRL